MFKSEEGESPSYYDEEMARQCDKGDGLFLQGLDAFHMACVTHWHDGKGFVTYPAGYKMGADRLIQSALQDPHNADVLIFPIVFLYRQYLELRLKQLIRDGNRLFGGLSDFPNTHRLDVLWESCKPVLKQVKLDDDGEVAWRVAEGIGAIETCILHFAHIDPTSMAFRYPVDKERTPFLRDLNTIDIQHFGEAMRDVASYLDAVALQLVLSLGEKVHLSDFGFDDELCEAFRKQSWLKKQSKREER